MDFVKEDSAGFLANHLARIFARGLSARIRPLGLTTGAFPALLALWEKDGQTQKQLTGLLDVEQATMANTLSRMERDGLVRRLRDETDGRVQRIWLTETARNLREPALQAAMEENRETLAPLSETDRRHFIRLLRTIIESSQARRSAEPGKGD
jgi:DNA-binding MarR family transcriptional regulator